MKFCIEADLYVTEDDVKIVFNGLSDEQLERLGEEVPVVDGRVLDLVSNPLSVTIASW